MESKPLGTETVLSLVADVGALLLRNGQTTERSLETASRLGTALGVKPTVLMRWGEILAFADVDGDQRCAVSSAEPTNVDMRKVSSAIRLIDRVIAGDVAPGAVRRELMAIEALPPAPIVRFAAFAGLGAAALGVVFGVSQPVVLLSIASIAACGALLRRGLAKVSGNFLVQPLAAAGLAGVLGAVAMRLGMAPRDALVAACPCMVLVPGPHFLNGALDLGRGRVALGSARLMFASVVVLVICVGLLVGLAAAGASLPVTGEFQRVPIAYDVLAAGTAVAAFGTFFNMPWRMLPIPVAIGMLSHAARWVIVFEAGGRPEVGALVACLMAGAIVTPVAARMHMPFAALAFASVVSLIPGIFIFRMSSGFVNLVALGGLAPPALLQSSAIDGATAVVIMIAMAFGLILPRMVVEYLFPVLSHAHAAHPKRRWLDWACAPDRPRYIGQHADGDRGRADIP
jgi:uncharacterized membrane protein YjjP (DUF1212 family)